MKPSARIDVLSRQSTISLPFRLHPIYVPHIVLASLIVLAWSVDGVLALLGWIGAL
ncbi:MAG: hypothetical protein WDM91_02830 [Rhizomicrobium sp.]